MEKLLALLDSLSGPQIEALTHVATAMLYAEPAQQDEYLTVKQIHERFDRSPTSIYKAMDKGLLPYTTPNGQEKPRYVNLKDVKTWLGRS